MEEHFQTIDADIIGLSEVDAIAGTKGECTFQLIKMMRALEYSVIYFPKSNNMSGSAIFYKDARFNCMESMYCPYSKDSSQFFMYARFNLKERPSFELIFGETHLKAKKEFIKDRMEQTKILKGWLERQEYQNMPIFIGGDFNEEP